MAYHWEVGVSINTRERRIEADYIASLKEKIKGIESRLEKADVYEGIISELSCLKIKLEVRENRLKGLNKLQLSSLDVKYKL